MKKQKIDRKIKQKVKKIALSVSSTGVLVECEGISQEKTESMLDRIIKKHKNFMVLKRKNELGSYIE